MFRAGKGRMFNTRCASPAKSESVNQCSTAGPNLNRTEARGVRVFSKGCPVQHYGFLAASACSSRTAAALFTAASESESAARTSERPASVCATL
jgi:hypothetical protein